VFLLCLAALAQAATLDVGAGYLFVDLQTALDVANSGDEIVLHEIQFNGDYLVTDKKKGPRSLTMRSATSLKGGSTLFAVSDAALTIRGDSLTLVGLTVDGDQTGRAARVDEGGTLRLEDSVVRDGDGGGGRAGCIEVLPGAHLELVDTQVTDCAAGGNGGAVFIGATAKEIGTLLVTRGEVDNNQGDDGGAIYCQGECTLVDVFVHHNNSGDDGGAVFATPESLLTVTGGTFSDNVATSNGSAGAIQCESPCTVDGAAFVANASGSPAGALRLDNGGTVRNSRFCDNHADTDGGAIHVTTGAEIVDSIFWVNTAANHGGALSVASDYDDVILDHLTLVGNAAEGFGEAIYRTRTTSTLVDAIAVWHDDKVKGVAVLGENGPGILDSDHTLFHGNTDPSHHDDGIATASLSGDPLFVDDLLSLDANADCLTADVRLQQGSPGIDKSGEAVGAAVACSDEIVGNGVDEDCDDLDACYADLDMDGFGDGDPVPGSLGCTDADEADQAGDCDDANPDANPDQVEVCDPLFADSDCDGDDDIAEGLTVMGYLDYDGDGIGENFGLRYCALPKGYVELSGDCDDRDGDVNPDATEICDNGIDDDCDPSTPDSCTTGDTGTSTDTDDPPTGTTDTGPGATTDTGGGPTGPTTGPGGTEPGDDDPSADAGKAGAAACGCTTPAPGPGQLLVGGWALLALALRRRRTAR